VRGTGVAAVAAVALLGFSGTAAATGSRAVVTTAFNKTLRTKILVDGNGRTLYMLTSDTSGKPMCAALSPACPKAWPALATTGAPRAGTGVKASLLGTVKGAGGVHQVTYNHHPLYTYHGAIGTPPGDEKPGDVHGQGFYGIWFVLSPKGIPIRHK
jgi:predicted lipoprotein with Yx(FWY)xxD motif